MRIRDGSDDCPTGVKTARPALSPNLRGRGEKVAIRGLRQAYTVGRALRRRDVRHHTTA